MDKKVLELTEKVDKLMLKINELEKTIQELKTGPAGTGIYLSGAPDYVRDYIKKEGEK